MKTFGQAVDELACGRSLDRVVEGILPSKGIDGFLKDVKSMTSPSAAIKARDFPSSVQEFVSGELSQALQRNFPQLYNVLGEKVDSLFQVNLAIDVMPASGRTNKILISGARTAPSADSVNPFTGNYFVVPRIDVLMVFGLDARAVLFLKSFGFDTRLYQAWMFGRISALVKRVMTDTSPSDRTARDEMIKEMTGERRRVLAGFKKNWRETLSDLARVLSHEMVHVMQFDRIVQQGNNPGAIMAASASKYGSSVDDPRYYRDQFELGAYAAQVARSLYSKGIRASDLMGQGTMNREISRSMGRGAGVAYDPKTPEGKKLRKYVYLYLKKFEGDPSTEKLP